MKSLKIQTKEIVFNLLLKSVAENVKSNNKKEKENPCYLCIKEYLSYGSNIT